MSKLSLKLDRNHPSYSAIKAITKMKYRDLKAACIARGMDFQDVVDGDFSRLSSWLISNYGNKQNRDLLEAFDQWIDDKLKERGYKKSDPFRQFREFSSLLENNDTKVRSRGLRNADISKKKKVKRERNGSFNIFKGTKKEYTYKLTDSLHKVMGQKYSTKELQKKFSSKLYNKVVKKFPDALEKSVKIWMKRALDEIQKNKKANL